MKRLVFDLRKIPFLKCLISIYRLIVEVLHNQNLFTESNSGDWFRVMSIVPRVRGVFHWAEFSVLNDIFFCLLKPTLRQLVFKGYFSLDDFYAWAACNGQNSNK